LITTDIYIRLKSSILKTPACVLFLWCLFYFKFLFFFLPKFSFHDMTRKCQNEKKQDELNLTWFKALTELFNFFLNHPFVPMVYHVSYGMNNLPLNELYHLMVNKGRSCNRRTRQQFEHGWKLNNEKTFSKQKERT